MKRALLLLSMTLLACHHHAHEEDSDPKKEGAHAATANATDRTAAEEAIYVYETAPSCDAKAQTMVYGASHRELLGSACPGHKIDDFKTRDCDKLASMLTQCRATARRDGNDVSYFLVRQPNGQFLVDFLATERPVQFADIAARMPSTPSVTRVRARTDQSYKEPFRGKQASYLALRIRAPKGDREAWGWAYVPRQSPDGVELASTLFANDYRDITIAISFPTKNPEVATVEKYFGVDFFETAAEHAFGKDGGT